jgi:hypothetical protein
MFYELNSRGVTDVISHVTLYDTLYDYYQKGIVTSGFCGDQLGSCVCQSCYGGDLDKVIRIPWQKFIMELFPYAYSSIDNLVQSSGLKIRNAFDLGWLLNVLLKWDYVSYNAIFWSASSRGKGSKLSLGHNFPFFSSDRFRYFGINYFRDHGLFHKTETRPFTKKFILDNTGDREYFENKTKDATMFIIRPSRGSIDKGCAVIDYAEV